MNDTPADTPADTFPTYEFLTGPLSPESTEPPADDAPGDVSVGRIFSRSFVMLLGAIALVGVTVIGAFALTREETKTVQGTYTLFDFDGVSGTASNCYGDGGYDDVEEGLQVLVRNGDDKLLATTSLENSVGRTVADVLGEKTSYSSFTRTLVECTFTFTAKVPAGEKFYAFSTGGNERRGKLMYSKADMEEKDWKVSISLGS